MMLNNGKSSNDEELENYDDKLLRDSYTDRSMMDRYREDVDSWYANKAELEDEEANHHIKRKNL